MESLIGYIAAGCMGIILGMLGGGGSILTVPILVYLFKVPALEATSYSLFVVGITSGISMLRYRKSQLLDIPVALFFLLHSMIGVWVARAWVLPQLPNTVSVPFLGSLNKNDAILLFFALLVLVIGIFMIKAKEPVAKTKANTKSQITPWLSLNGLLIGLLTGIIGAGGGFIIVPILTLVARIPLRHAIATSLLIITGNAASGMIADFATGLPQLNFVFLIPFLGITIVGGYVGTILNSKVPVSKLRRGFAGLVIAVGISMLIRLMG